MNPRHVSWTLLLMLFAGLSQAQYNSGNYRRDMDEANRQRAAEQSRRDSESANRRNEEMRNNTYKPASSGSVSSGSSAGSSSSSGGYAGSAASQPSGPQSIERTETVTVHIQETPEQTVARLMREAEAGNVESQWNLGRLYNTGGLGGVQLDEAKAAKWFRKAGEAGHAQAALAYGEMLFNGKGMAANTQEAGKWFRIAAERGIPKAMYMWGLLLEIGHGTAQDAQAAYAWFKKAADGGETRAYNSLGDLYSEGRGVTANAAEAAKWYRKGMESGDAAATASLGGLYYSGNGVAKDEAQAARLFLRAAEGGNRNAMFNMGLIHEQGLMGMPRDLNLARTWFGKAAAAGVADARVALERLGEATPSGSARADIAGRYTATGKNPNGSTYRGEVTIEQRGGQYHFYWKIANDAYQGKGQLEGGKFVIDWGDTYPVIYTLASDGRLMGTWSNGAATEVLAPVR
ncbi:MAG: tetratricopeptide repeat protein [Pseudomonadota bacterium]